MKKTIAYVYDENIGKYNYGSEQYMKPKRVTMTNELIKEYGLLKEMDLYSSPIATEEELEFFHSKNYVNFIKNYFNLDDKTKNIYSYGINDTDTPAFPEFYDFNKLVAGSSLLSSSIILNQKSDVVINWMGGLHHAKKCKASGFCYINDIVLGIQRLLFKYERVLYVDIDVHHGDGVEEAFLKTNRVMTFSIHQYCKEEIFFPGTGDVTDIGEGYGKFHSVNVPLKMGIEDDQYRELYKVVLHEIMQSFNPSAIWLQCGSDSIVGDLIGGFNLTIKGHSNAVKEVLKYNIPTIIVGGGGYTIENVTRCWTYETAMALDIEIEDRIPSDYLYYDYFKDDPFIYYENCKKKLHENKNTNDYLNKIRENVLTNLRSIDHRPNVEKYDIPNEIIKSIN